MAKTLFAREALDEGAEVLHAGDAAGVDLTVLDGGAAGVAAASTFATATAASSAADGVDFLNGAGHRGTVVGVNEDLAGIIVGDVDLRAGGLDDAADVFAAGADEGADLLGIDLDGLDAGRVGAELLAGSGQAGEHHLEDLDAGLAGLVHGDGGDLEGQALYLKVELEAGDAFGGAGDFEVHVAEMVFLTEDVGDGGPFSDGVVGVVLGHEADGNAGDGSDDGHAGVHEGETAAADRGH